MKVLHSESVEELCKRVDAEKAARPDPMEFAGGVLYFIRKSRIRVTGPYDYEFQAPETFSAVGDWLHQVGTKTWMTDELKLGLFDALLEKMRDVGWVPGCSHDK